MPEVSFVMPAYNAASTIREAIDAVRSQTVKDWELIIVDDASTDNTLNIAREYAELDSRIRVASRPLPSGHALTPRTKAVEISSSYIIAPIDADDSLENDYLERLIDIKESSGADIVFPLMYTWHVNNPGPLQDPGKWPIGKPLTGRDSIKLTLDGWKVCCNGGLIPKKIYLDAINLLGRNSSDIFADETLTRYILLLSPKVLFTSIPYLYRENHDSLTHEITIRRLDILQSCRQVCNLALKEFGKDSEEYLLSQRHLLHSFIDLLYIIDGPRFNPEMRSEAFKILEQYRPDFNYSVLTGNESPLLIFISRQSLPVMRRLLRLRSFAKNALSEIKFQFSRPKRKYNSLKNLYLDKKAFQRELTELSKGIISKESESGMFYDKFYTKGDSDYHTGKSNQPTIVICPFDGRLLHGGNTDRIRGILSTYQMTKRRGIPLKISWTCPFNLEDYLVPAKVDWRISPEELHYQKGMAAPVVIQDRSDSESKKLLEAALDGLTGEIHVYSNSNAARGGYQQLYKDLFQPSEKLHNALLPHLKILGKEYYAFTFRFTALLGDFKDTLNFTLPLEEQQILMHKNLKELQSLASSIPSDSKILVTSDSKRFLDYIKDKDERIYIVPGDILHVDLCSNKNDNSDNNDLIWLKTFVDQHLLMHAKRVTRMTTGSMYAGEFARFAAEVGGTEFVDHRF